MSGGGNVPVSRLIYIAGPISHADPEIIRRNVEIACSAFLQLVDLQIPAVCPHLSALIPGAFDLPYESWIDNGLEQLRRCSAVWVLPNWTLSRGTLLEVAEARKLQLPLHDSLYKVVKAHAPHWLSLGDKIHAGTNGEPARIVGKYWSDTQYEIGHV